MNKKYERSCGRQLALVLRKLRGMSLRKKLACIFLGIIGLAINVSALNGYSVVYILLQVLLVIVSVYYLSKNQRLILMIVNSSRNPTSEKMSIDLRAEHTFGPAVSWSNEKSLTASKLVQRTTILRSLGGRDVLARLATAGRWNWSDWETALEMYRLEGYARSQIFDSINSFSKAKLVFLADLCYRQNIRPTDMLNAATLYRFVYESIGMDIFLGSKRSEFFLDSLCKTQQGELVLEILSSYDIKKINAGDLNLFRANAMRSSLLDCETNETWLAEINSVYDTAGLAKLVLRDGSGSLFSRLGTENVKQITDGPLVTIVMPVFRPNDFADLAIRSALMQSYINIEIIIVDDGSGEAYSHMLLTWESLDPRIKVLRNKQNEGSYTSRNIGYSRARGKYLTVFDSDDWQHPQKIEILVASAEGESKNRLVSAPWARADQNLLFYYRGWRGAFITPAHVSTMFPTAVIRESLGYWDTVRKAADTEFILRYQILVNSEEPLETTTAPLTLALVGQSNLSMDDFRLGYRSPDRIAYRDSYEHWHEKIRRGESSGYLDFPSSDRLFPAPSKFLPQKKSALSPIDWLLVSDFSHDSQDSWDFSAYILAAKEQGLSVGLMHRPSILSTTSIDIRFPVKILEMFAQGSLVRVEISDAIEVKTVYVFDPTAFQDDRLQHSEIRAQAVNIVTDLPSLDPITGRHNFETRCVNEVVSKSFGVKPVWQSLT